MCWQFTLPKCRLGLFHDYTRRHVTAVRIGTTPGPSKWMLASNQEKVRHQGLQNGCSQVTRRAKPMNVLVGGKIRGRALNFLIFFGIICN